MMSFFIIFTTIFSISFLFSSVEIEQREPLYYQNINIEDNYNSTFQLDIKFSTDSPEFLVGKNINIHANLKRIHNNSDFHFTGAYFALVSSEGHTMPFQSSHSSGNIMNETSDEFFILNYDTILYFPSQYDCRLKLQYYNITNTSNIKPIFDDIYIGPIIEILPTSTELQIKWSTQQIVLTNRIIGSSLLVLMLSLINLLFLWIDKFEEIFYYQRHIESWNKFKRWFSNLIH